MEASRSIACARGFAIISGASAMKSASANARGRATESAMSVVIRVPKMAFSAPNSSVTGFHFPDTMKSSPNSFHASEEDSASCAKNALMKISTANAHSLHVFLKMKSADIFIFI